MRLMFVGIRCKWVNVKPLASLFKSTNPSGPFMENLAGGETRRKGCVFGQGFSTRDITLVCRPPVVRKEFRVKIGL